MSGIPVYTSSPVQAAKAPGQIPRTTAPPAPNSDPLTSDSAPTAANASASSYPQARPGASAMPAPTAAAQRYAPLRPTPTTKTDDIGPPAPQPGAVPTPSSRSAVPPPPKLCESYQQPSSAAPPQASSPPAQMEYAPPSMTDGSQPPKASTRTDNTPSTPYPVQLPTAVEDPRQSLEHPPGYQQNVYASELTSDQRRAQATELANSSSTFGISHTGSAGGFDDAGLWNTAKKWAQQAGEKISATEQEVWKKINKE